LVAVADRLPGCAMAFNLPAAHSLRGDWMRAKFVPIEQATAVRASGRRAKRWRARRIRIVLGKRDRREMAECLAYWDRWLAERGRKEGD
jgi:hypothetical protein